MQTNETRIKFTGNQYEVPFQLTMQQEVAFTGQGEIVLTAHKNQHDGTVNAIHTIKPKLIEFTASEHTINIDTAVAQPRSKSWSQKQRDKWYLIWEREYTRKYNTFDSFYASVMERIDHLQSLILEDELALKSMLRYQA